jgi:hypothetical protein
LRGGLSLRDRKKKATIGVRIAMVAIPNNKNVTSTPSELELGL